MKDKRYLFGLWATGTYCFALGIFMVTRWSDVVEMKPNELGDALAGAAGPLAFLWLVLGYLQQGDELRQNTAAINLQAEELRKSVEHQAQLVAVGKQQLEEERIRSLDSRFPRFVLTAAQAYDNETDETIPTRHHLHIKNMGAECTHVAIQIEWPDHSDDRSLPPFPTFAEMGFWLAWPDDNLYACPVTFRITAICAGAKYAFNYSGEYLEAGDGTLLLTIPLDTPMISKV